jgi:hypothetical protein
LHALLIDQPQKCLIHQGCPLQGVLRPLTPQVLLGESPQLLIDEWHQFAESGLVASTPLNQQLRHATVRL